MSDLTKELDGLSGKPELGTSVTVNRNPQPTGSLSDELTNMANAPKVVVPTIANPHPGEVERSFWYDTFHPQPADLSKPQTFRDWATKTYTPTATDYGNTALDDFTMGGADWLDANGGQHGNIDEIRARTEASRRALGPMAWPVAAASYVAGPGKILGPLAAIGKGAKTAVKAGRAAVEAFGAGAASSEGHNLGSDKDQIERGKEAAWEGLKTAPFGVVGNWVGRTVGPRQSTFDRAQGSPGRAGDPWFGHMRTAAKQGQDISPLVQQFQRRSGYPMDDVLKANDIGTGPTADAARQAGRLAGHVVAGHFAPLLGWISKTPGDVGQAPVNWAYNRARNYQTQNALDAAHDRISTGPPLTADTSGWRKAIEQLTIGGSLP